ncbi:HAD-IIB family hydrolase [Marinomonas ostreistagni]|uniref:HAD-IIB family hydrolase n=1 Tax=Marinomonas ostreistagni TaxID=359209 RepID=UPI0019522E26|nr:HAD-IIB family hydrolase [Marinomonas ostreistagni]MBM6551958.1 HAD-IIB family hydrolase [Marinomonas ostreistagni]
MDLVVFDLDGTLLNKQQRLSQKTISTLEKMKQAGIYYTIATGRTHLSAMDCLTGHDFPLWQIYKNGVEWWHPTDQVYRHQGILDVQMIKAALEHFEDQGVTPFIFCIEADGQQSVYHPELHDHYGEAVVAELAKHDNLTLLPLEQLPADANVINISALGHPDPLANIVTGCNEQEHLVAYSGGGIYHPQTHWIDIHHHSTCKGSAIKRLQQELNADRLVVFGDGDNDLTMFKLADEAYAMDNAPYYIKDQASAAIGHHDQDGVAEFLRKKYNL